MQLKTWHPVHLTHACSWDSSPAMQNDVPSSFTTLDFWKRTLDAWFHKFLVLSGIPLCGTSLLKMSVTSLWKILHKKSRKKMPRIWRVLAALTLHAFKNEKVLWLKCIPANCCKPSFPQNCSVAACYLYWIGHSFRGNLIAVQSGCEQRNRGYPWKSKLANGLASGWCM